MRVTYDATPGDPATEPRAGDLLESSRSTYAVLAARQVRSRVHPSRWALEVERVGPGRENGEGPDTGRGSLCIAPDCDEQEECQDRAHWRRVLPLVWYPRGRKPRHASIESRGDNRGAQ